MRPYYTLLKSGSRSSQFSRSAEHWRFFPNIGDRVEKEMMLSFNRQSNLEHKKLVEEIGNVHIDSVLTRMHSWNTPRNLKAVTESSLIIEQ